MWSKAAEHGRVLSPERSSRVRDFATVVRILQLSLQFGVTVCGRRIGDWATPNQWQHKDRVTFSFLSEQHISFDVSSPRVYTVDSLCFHLFKSHYNLHSINHFSTKPKCHFGAPVVPLGHKTDAQMNARIVAFINDRPYCYRQTLCI